MDHPKPNYKANLANAIKWIQENPTEKAVTAGRIFDVKPQSIRMALKRTKRKTKAHGGNNKILSNTQLEAIRVYCREQYEAGLGATKQMVFAAIGQLLLQSQPPRKPPSWRWFQTWLKANPNLHTITTKPIARNRVDTHDEKDVEEWFDKYRATLAKYGIRKGKNIYNMDESGARVGCPKGEEVIVPIEVKEMYTSSPENRKSVTIIEAISADGREPPPPLVICPGKRIMESWIHDNLKGGEMIGQSETGYTNERIAIAWLNHFIKYTKAGPDKPWKLLLLDGHITHENPDFVILAHKNNIKPMEYPSHLTHVLQPLDVGVFRPWKHYHNQAIHHALHSLDFEYTITSFFRDLSTIREKTMKPYTIRNSFRDSGMWPISCKTAVKKMRQYSKKKTPDSTNNVDSLPSLQPTTYYQCETGLQEWEEKMPIILSSPSRKKWQDWAHGTKVQLTKAQLQSHEIQMMQIRLTEHLKARTGSRRSISVGGPLEVEKAREKKEAKAQKEKDEAIRKAEKAVNDAINKAKKALHRRGIDARKAERERKKAIAQFDEEFIPIELLTPIRDPSKDPTSEDLESLKPHPCLVQALEALRPPVVPIDPQLLGDSDDEVAIQLERVVDMVRIVDDKGDSDDDELEGSYSSESEESMESIDSIARNADFISLY
jgi:hypothetical protein